MRVVFALDARDGFSELERHCGKHPPGLRARFRDEVRWL